MDFTVKGEKGMVQFKYGVWSSTELTALEAEKLAQQLLAEAKRVRKVRPRNFGDH